MGKGQKQSSFLSCFGGFFSRVQDVPSPRGGTSPAKASPSSAQGKNDKAKGNKPTAVADVAKLPSFTRLSLSYTDFSNSTLFTSTEYLSSLSSSLVGANLHIFTLAELKAATGGFSSGNFLGEGGFGPVYKGFFDDKLRPGLKAQTIAVKLLDLDGMQGHKEWLTEVILLGQLRHPHLVKLIGYCYEEKHRVLVYEFMARGSLENHLFNKRFFPSLSWEKRIKIAYGAAKGLAFLHGVDQPVIYRDFKASNILLDSDFKAKLSDFGLAKDGPQGDDTHVSTRVMGTRGYAAPEYIMTGHLTAKSDVYSFGVVLLELLTGRRSVDKSKPSREQNLVEWARTSLNDPRKLNKIIDPGLEGQYSLQGAQNAAALAYQCLSHLPKSRPRMSTVVEVLEPLLNCDDIATGTFVFTVRDESDKTSDAAMKPGKESKDGDKPTTKEGDAEKPSNEGNQEKLPTPKEDGRVQQHRHHHQHRHNRDAAAKAGREHRHHRHHRHNVRSPKQQTSYTDTALYRKSPRHRGGGA